MTDTRVRYQIDANLLGGLGGQVAGLVPAFATGAQSSGRASPPTTPRRINHIVGDPTVVSPGDPVHMVDA